MSPADNGWTSTDDREKYGPEVCKSMGPPRISAWKVEASLSPCCEQERSPSSQEKMELHLGTHPSADTEESIPCGEGQRTPGETSIQAGIYAGKKEKACGV